MLGIHVARHSKVFEDRPHKIRKNMLNAIRIDTIDLGLNAAQIFTHGPRNRRPNNMDYTAIKNFNSQKNITLMVHSSYMTQAIWSVKNANKDEKSSKINIQHVEDQLVACKKLGAVGLVIHIPHRPIAEIIESMAIMEQILKKHKVPILLENGAHAPSEKSYESPEKLNLLCQALSETFSTNLWGLCIDTAHLWASNVDLSDKINAKNWLNAFDYKSLVKLVHFNGTATKFGVNKDVHSVAFAKSDKMWEKHQNTPKESGAYAFIKFCTKNNIPMICEINQGAEDAPMSLEIIKNLMIL